MNTSHALLLAAGLVAGFVAGQIVFSDTRSDSRPASDAVSPERIAALETERDNWKQRAVRAEQRTLRVEMPGTMDDAARGRGATSDPASPSAGRSNATSAKPSVAATGQEQPDPQEAARLLAGVREALVSGDAAALEKLLGDVAKQAGLLVPALVSQLQSAESLFAKEQLAKMLGKLADPRALGALQELLESESDDAVRTSVVRALGAIPDGSSIGLLASEFRRASTSPMPASLAATSLGNIGSSEAIGALTKEITEGKNGMVRAFAIRALAAQKSKELAPFFLSQVRRKDANDRYRRSAIEALVATGDQNSLYELRVIALSPESSKALQEAAKRAVNQMSGKRVFDVR